MNKTINPFFNAPFYLGMNNDLIRAGLNIPDQLWHHYTHYGAYEIADTPDAWRVPNAWFDVTHHLSPDPDLSIDSFILSLVIKNSVKGQVQGGRGK